MGYELHIVRFSNQKRTSISLKEWTEYLKQDSSLIENQEEEDTFLWIGHPIKKQENERPWLRYFEGRISTRKPDEFLILKMFEIAENLNAKISDDEDILDFTYKIEIEKDCQRILQRFNQVKKPWWKFW